MSAGKFTPTKYQANNLDIHPIRVQPETLALAKGASANTAPSGTITPGALRAKVSRGNREYGLKPRAITVVFDSSPPDGYATGTFIRIPILQSSLWESITEGDNVSYLGGTARVAGKSEERRR